MSEENNKIWYNTNKEYDLRYNAAKTMDNYQEWINPSTVIGDMNITDPIIKYIESCIQ